MRAMYEAQAPESAKSNVPKGDYKDPKYLPSSTDHLSEEEYLKQVLPGYYETAKLFKLDWRKPEHKKQIDHMVERGLERRRARLKRNAEQANGSSIP